MSLDLGERANRRSPDDGHTSERATGVRLASQWSEAIGRSVDDLARQAQHFIQEELTTVEGLVAQAEDRRPAVEQGLAAVRRLYAAMLAGNAAEAP